MQRIHEAKIIHADLKPDNILVCAQLPEDKPITQLLDFPLIRLIDFGRAIDMNYFRGKSFTGKAKTQCFECEEMKVSFFLIEKLTLQIADGSAMDLSDRFLRLCRYYSHSNSSSVHGNKS